MTEILWKPSSREGFESVTRPHGTTSIVLPKGWRQREESRAMTVETIWDKDQPIELRDGTIVYCDIFRPSSTENTPVPALVAWGPFNKSSNGFLSLDRMKFRVGIPAKRTSGLENWEGPDPAEWCGRGYAVVNVCARGSYDSTGNHVFNGTQEGRDGYDAIEWLAKQDWCSGKTCMTGNSWLASSQWVIAAEQPPSLTAIAPWEGMGDYYRESICRGGIPEFTFWELLLSKFVAGNNKREDVANMVQKYPFVNDYWLDKKPRLDRIQIPMYALMSYSTLLHTEGSFRGFFMSGSQQKWLRVHHTHEWHDLYQPHNTDDLQKFCDHFLKGVDNGWSDTPQIRLSLLGYNRPSVINRPVASYPPSNFRYHTLHLDSTDLTLSSKRPVTDARSIYNAEQANDAQLEKLNGVGFTYTFKEYTEMCGWSKATLYMSAVSAEDMDVFVILRKLDASGKALQHINIPLEDLPKNTRDQDIPMENVFRYIGPNGRLRASHRAVKQEPGLTDAQRAQLSEAYVWHPHDRSEKLEKGQIVKLEIHLWPGGIVFDSGESMRLEIKGVHPAMPEFEALLPHMPNHNIGEHRIHTGPTYPSTYLVALSSDAHTS